MLGQLQRCRRRRSPPHLLAGDDAHEGKRLPERKPLGGAGGLAAGLQQHRVPLAVPVQEQLRADSGASGKRAGRQAAVQRSQQIVREKSNLGCGDTPKELAMARRGAGAAAICERDCRAGRAFGARPLISLKA